MKSVAISFALLAVFIGTIVYHVYLPLFPVSAEDSVLLPMSIRIMYDLASVGEKLRIAHRHKIVRALASLADLPKWVFSRKAAGHSIKDTTISDVPVRIYRSKSEPSQNQLRPALIYFHGGGLVFGEAKSGFYDILCSTFSERTKSTVISVEYRLALEHEFPAGFQDCYDVVTAVIKEAKTFGVIKDKIAIGGDSAGGLLAAAVSLQLAKENRPKEIAAQSLLFPWLQSIDVTCLPSYQKYANKFSLSRGMMAFFCSCAATGKSDFEQLFLSGNISRYLMDTPYWKFLEIPEGLKCNVPAEKPASIPSEIIKAVLDPRLSPLLADSVKGSPPSLIVIAEYDVLASEGNLYAQRLEKAGVPVIQNKYKGYHGFIWNIAHPFIIIPIAEEAMQDVINYLNSTFYET